jgi:hypothetical protein
VRAFVVRIHESGKDQTGSRSIHGLAYDVSTGQRGVFHDATELWDLLTVHYVVGLGSPEPRQQRSLERENDQ